MDLKALRYFVATVEAGTITGASERCFVAQPSITAAIQKLEDEFDTKLFHRQKRGVSVTPEGASFYQQAKSLLQHAASIEKGFKGPATQASIRIGVSHSIAYEYLEQLLSQLKRLSPRLQCKLIRGEPDSNDWPDIRLTMEQRIAEDEEFIPCWRDRYCIIIPNDHPLAYQSGLDISDFDGAPMILRTFCDRNQELVNFLKHHNLTVNIVAEVDNEEWALSLVESGLGIAIVPLPKAVKDSKRFSVLPLGQVAGTQDFERTIGVAIRYRQYQSPFYQEIANTLKATFLVEG